MNLIIIIFIIILLIIIKKKVLFSIDTHKNAFCLLVRKPDNIWLDFISTFTDNYDVYVVVDDNDDISNYQSKYKNIKFLQFDNNKLIKQGYYNLSTRGTSKQIISWDKAVYYFSKIQTKYNYVWFCEDDVYIPNVKNIIQIDIKYNQDLLCPDLITTDVLKPNEWHWFLAEPYFELPFFGGLQAFCRVSKNLLNKINQFVIKYKKLEFAEVLFPTLAKKNDLSIIVPDELKHLSCCEKLDSSKLDNMLIHHPLKKTDDHLYLRSK
jgi:hypothetical protein